MTQPKVFVLTLLALKVEIEGSQLTGGAGASTTLSVQISDEAAEAQGWTSVREKYPESESWFGHQVTIFELPSQLDTNGYQVTFAITEAGGAA